MRLRVLIIIIFSLNTYTLFAQLGIGEWRDHLAYSHVKKVSISGDNIFAITDQALFVYNTEENEIEKISKISGLSDFGIADIAYSSELNMTILAYTNGNIDLIYNNGSIYNIPDIYNKLEFGSITLNQLIVRNESAYLAASFGIVVLNLNKREIKETYFIGDNGAFENVQNIYLSNDSIYALMGDIIKMASLDNSFLVDFNSWEKLSLPDGTTESHFISGIDNTLALCSKNQNYLNIYLRNALKYNSWENVYSTSNEIRDFYTANNQYYIIKENSISIYNSLFNLVDEITDYGFGDLNANYAIKQDNNIYIADDYLGLITYKNSKFTSIYPNSPLFSHSHVIKSKGDYLYVGGGAVDLAWNNIFNRPELHRFTEEEWKSNVLWDVSGRDIINLCVDPYNEQHIFAATWSDGVYEFEGLELKKIYNQSNSPLQNIIPFTEGFVRVGGMTYDAEHNLWINNSDVSTPLHVLKNNGEWKSFSIGNLLNAPTMGDMLVDNYNQKWIILPRGHGLLVYNDNFTIDDESDDYFKQLDINDESGSLISNNIFSIAHDLDGVIWLGSDKGILTYYNPGGFKENQNFFASRLKVFEQDNDSIIQYLLETETITAIAVDGANRKWLGTSGAGAFLVSDDGQETIVSFNTSNSPLISNTIKDIEINENSGEVFFATDLGIVSYKGTATTGHADFYDVYVYPNPVMPNYTGEITITGLVSNVNVKITNIAGNIVYETKALGGQAQWNGRNFDGKRVATGVYLVFNSNEDGSKTFVTKILFYN